MKISKSKLYKSLLLKIKNKNKKKILIDSSVLYIYIYIYIYIYNSLVGRVFANGPRRPRFNPRLSHT